MIDRDQNVLRCSDIWTAPGRRFEEFDGIGHGAVAPGVGLPGRVWASGEPAWIPDVVRDPNFPRPDSRTRRSSCGVRLSVMLHGEVLSVMEFFSLEIRPPDDELLSMLSSVGNQIGLFYGRRRAQDDLDRFFTRSTCCALSASIRCFKRVNPRLAACARLHVVRAGGASVHRVHSS